MKKTILVVSAISLLMGGASNALAGPDAAAIFKSKCTMCHDLKKKKMGPAFKDMNKDPAVLKQVITNGRKMMPKWAGKLSAEEIDAMVAFIQKHQK